jgi:hypothetical protein
MKYKVTGTEQYYKVEDGQVPHLPFRGDLSMRLDTRSGGTLNDSAGEYDATVLVPELLCPDSTTGLIGDATRACEKILDGNNYTIYLRAKFEEDIEGERRMFNAGTTSGRYFKIYNYYNQLRVRCSDGSNNDSAVLTSDKTNDLVPLNYFDVVVQVDGANELITAEVYGDNGLIIGTDTIDLDGWTLNGDDNATYFSLGRNSGNAIVTNFKKFTAIKTHSQCIDNSYVTDLQIWVPTLMCNADISGNGNHFSYQVDKSADDVVWIDFNTSSLVYGVDRWVDPNGTYANRYLNYTPSGQPTIDQSATTPALDHPMSGYRITAERAGVTNEVNHPDCKIRFTHDFFDRSDTEIWGAAARLGYYDEDNTKDFHISELNQRTIQTWLNDGYKGRFFVKFTDNSIEDFDRKYLTEMMLYDSNKTGADHLQVLTYTEDILAAIYDGDSIDYDANNQVQLGTLKTTKPMVTIRFDDTRDDHYNNYLPLMNAQGITNVLTGCHSNQMGETVGSVDFLDWDSTRVLYETGWEVACHNREDDDYNTVEFLNDIEDNFNLARTEQESQGIPCNIYVGNKHTSAGPQIPYYAHKVGFSAHLAWGNYGTDGNGANNQAIDRYNLSAIPADLATPDNTYNLEQDPNTSQIAAIKAEIDKCVSGNRWLIIMLHDYTASKAVALNEIIDYAQTNSISFVTVSQALSNTSYQ